jgi:hypothetical protein
MRTLRQFIVPLALVALVALVAASTPLAMAGWGAAVKGSGNKVSEDRQVADFHAVSSKGSIDVVFTSGATSLRLEGDDNILELIETEVEDGVLVISSRVSYATRSGLTAYVSAPTLDGVWVKGSGDVSGKGIEGESLEVGVYGSGDIELSGNVQRLKVSVKGSGDVDLDGLSAVDAEVSVMGSGDVNVHVTGQLDASVMGSGDIMYSGGPVVKQSVMGSGDIEAR